MWKKDSSCPELWTRPWRQSFSVLGGIFLLWGVAVAMIACSDDDGKKSIKTGGLTTESDSGAVAGTDGGTDGGSSAADDSATASGNDPQAESETPPALPSRCTTHIVAQKLSGPGSGMMPSLSSQGDDMMAAFSYNSKEPNAQTKIQLGYYDAEANKWLTAYPFEDAVMSARSAIFQSADSRGLVWLEGRAAWTPGCSADTPDACQSDVAFATLTGGQLNQSTPIRVSPNGGASGRPAAVPVADGWVVIFGQSISGDVSILSAKVTSDGTVSTPQIISGDYLPSRALEISAASLNDGTSDHIIAVWRGDEQDIDFVKLDTTGTPIAPSAVLEDGANFSPRITAGATAFLVSFGQNTPNDAEIFTRVVDTAGHPISEKNRITWTDSPIVESYVAYTPQLGYAITWLSTKANGNASCVDPVCKTKVFAAPLDTTGALSAAPILVSEGNTDLNPCSAVTLGATTTTWMTAYEILRNLRQQILYSTFTCQ